MLRSLILALAVLIALPAAAHAADVVSPVDGETVGSRPQFMFDFVSGAADIELSRSSDVKTAGDETGAFVEPTTSDFRLVSDGQPVLWRGERVVAGRYFWHVKAHSYDDMSAPEVWSPTRTFTVRDEPVILEGWTARAKRLRGRSSSCHNRVQVGGRIAFDDNDADESIRYTVAFSAAGRTVGRVRGTNASYTDYAGVICTNARRLRVMVTLRDRGGHLVGGAPRQISVR